jgi:uroporphyrinogen-III synthase
MAYAVLTRGSIEDYARSLAGLGLEAVAMPVTRHVAPPDPDALSRALAEPFDVVFVASARAAARLIAAAATAKRRLPAVWVVGRATQLVLESAGIAAHHPAGVRDGDGLANALVHARRGKAGRVLVPRAASGRDEPLATLRAGGLDVVDVIAYATVADPTHPEVEHAAQLLRDGSAAVCAVFAPSQADALDAIVGPLAAVATRYCAIGETTAAALRALGATSVSVAPEPTPAGMARAAAAVYPARTP